MRFDSLRVSLVWSHTGVCGSLDSGKYSCHVPIVRSVCMLANLCVVYVLTGTGGIRVPGRLHFCREQGTETTYS